MLRSLHIENYVLIDSLDIDFPEGLVIITGQTGAGKSILMGALALLTGAKADASQISAGADKCVVEGEFLISDSDGELRSVLDENEVDWDEGRLIVRRVINSTGRSRAFVNDSPVAVQTLSDLASRLVDIHSQHQSMMLSDRKFQLSMLDHFAGNGELLLRSGSLWADIRKLEAEAAAVEDRIRRLSEDREYNRSRFLQLDQAGLRDGELEELEAEQKQLANAEEIKDALSAATELFNPSEDELRGVDSALKEASRILERIARYMPSMEDLSKRIQSSRMELSDIADEIAAADSSVSVSEDRLREVEDRMSLIYELFRKYSCRTVAELIEARERYAEAVSDTETLEEQLDGMRAGLSRLDGEFKEVCGRLQKARIKAAPVFAESILGSLRSLELDRAAFCVDVIPAAAGPSGTDSVLFRFSSNGTAPVDVAKCASGGEISRIMLSLKAMMARFVGMPTMIFDEIDTGVSGSTADRIGSMICDMGKDMQVIAITHLPQVAAKGNAHFVVSKNDVSGRMQSSITRVDGELRVREIARLLSGTTVTPQALANARALLDCD